MHAPPQQVAASVHVANKIRIDFHFVSLGVLFLPVLVRCSIFGRNGASVTLQNRSTVFANFGLIGMSI